MENFKSQAISVEILLIYDKITFSPIKIYYSNRKWEGRYYLIKKFWWYYDNFY